MTVFEKIKEMNIDEFAKWFDKHCTHDDDPCIKWWNDIYCSQCETVMARYDGSDRDMEFAWCEIYGKCRFFQDMEETPNTLEMTKLWLESEA